MKSQLCPRCDQGALVLMTVLATGEKILICDECEAVWPEGSEVMVLTFVDFSTYMSARGLTNLWHDELAAVNDGRGPED